MSTIDIIGKISDRDIDNAIREAKPLMLFASKGLKLYNFVFLRTLRESAQVKIYSGRAFEIDPSTNVHIDRGQKAQLTLEDLDTHEPLISLKFMV